MSNYEKLLAVVYEALDVVNQMLPIEKQVSKSEDLEIFGKDAALDSLAQVNLLVAMEEKMGESLGIYVSFADLLGKDQQQRLRVDEVINWLISQT